MADRSKLAEYYDAELANVTGQLFDAVKALNAIWKIVHTPTKDTRHRSADDHFQADFDSIRKIIVASGAAGRGSEQP
jgi:hypothetical protein